MSPLDEKIFYVEFLREKDRIRVRSHEGMAGEQKTLKYYYEDLKVSIGKTEEYSRRIKDLLSRVNRSGKISKEILNSLKQAGQLLYDELFPTRTKEMLNNTAIRTLVLGIDDGLVHIPWELVFDGKEFLCLRFNMGRVVSTRQEFTAGQRDVGIPLKMLVLSDPQGNLKASYEEGIKLRDRLDEKAEVVNVNLKSSDIHTDYVKGKLRYFDIVHYAGHADYDNNDPSESGFLLSDGKLKAKDIKAAITLSLKTKEKDEVGERLGREILDKLKPLFPLQAKVVSVTGNEVSIDIGSDAEMIKSLRMEVLTDKMDIIGEIEVISVMEKQSRARVLSGKGQIKEGSMVREIL